MIPLSVLAAVLQLLIEALRAFSALPEKQRVAIVDDMLSDKRDWSAFWGRAGAWWTTAWAKVGINEKP